MVEISPEAVVSPAPNQIASELDNEAVILNLDSGTYYGLNEVGARIWEMIQESYSIRKLQTTLLAEYDVQPDACYQALLSILEELQKAHLIDITNEKA